MILLQIYQSVSEKNCENLLTFFGEVMGKSLVSYFLTHSVSCSCPLDLKTGHYLVVLLVKV